MAWMAWTLPTALFFVSIGSALLVLTIWELRAPTELRKGWLPMATTRGDRFFVSLLAAAFVHIAWLAALDGPIFAASGLAGVLAFCIWRWG